MAAQQPLLAEADLRSIDEAESCVVKIASTRDELEQTFRLIQRAYERAGLADPSPCGLRITPYQLQSSASVFTAILRGEVISTISLIADDELGLPLETAFAEEISKLRATGVHIAEASCLADRRQHLLRRIPVLRQLFRWMVQAARHQGIDCLVLAVHPKHTKFYQRFLACDLLAARICQLESVMNQPAAALLLDFHKIDRERPVNYDLFFGEPIPVSMLRQPRMSPEDLAYFQQRLPKTPPAKLEISGAIRKV